MVVLGGARLAVGALDRRFDARAAMGGRAQQVAHVGQHFRIIGCGPRLLELRQAMRDDWILAGGHRGVGGRQAGQAHRTRAQGHGQVVGDVLGHAQLAGDLDHLGRAQVVGQAHGGHVRRAGEGGDQRHLAGVVLALVVLGHVAADLDRGVEDRAGRGHARLQGGQIDEDLEGRARLAPGVGAVELAGLVVAPADHGDDAAVLAHGHQGALGDVQDLAVAFDEVGQDLFGLGLELGIQGRLDDGFPIASADGGAGLGQGPVGEVGAGWQLVRRFDRRDLAHRVGLSLGNGLGLDHGAQNDAHAFAGAFDIVGRGEA